MKEKDFGPGKSRCSGYDGVFYTGGASDRLKVTKEGRDNVSSLNRGLKRPPETCQMIYSQRVGV